MTCHRGFVKYKNKNNLESRFHLKHPRNTIFFNCSDACAGTAYNAKTTYVQHIQPSIVSVGDKVTLVCKNGHRLVAGNLTRICQKNGSWSGENPICKPCTVATFYVNTTDAHYFQPNDRLNVGDNVTYTCKRGHRLAAGNLTRICQENGSWSGEEPICKPCSEAAYNTSTTNAQYYGPNGTLSVGDNVTYTCKRGHRLAAGNLTRICQENGSWSGEEPICKPCSEAAYNTSTTNAQYYGPNGTLSVGDNVTYTCKRGHRLAAGNLTRICQENGSWTGEKPYCKRCKCSCKRLASQNFIKDPIVLQQRIEETKKFLAVNRSELSAFKRKKISSHDGRASSTGIGMALGVGVITFVIGAIVCSDLLTCRARRRRRTFRKA
nr:sushi, von Willebrand factor type A, EGF and pentraxin domain-containing protein 1-like [Crassostrea gigas]